jgi:hypothetical protein
MLTDGDKTSPFGVHFVLFVNVMRRAQFCIQVVELVLSSWQLLVASL